MRAQPPAVLLCCKLVTVDVMYVTRTTAWELWTRSLGALAWAELWWIFLSAAGSYAACLAHRSSSVDTLMCQPV